MSARALSRHAAISQELEPHTHGTTGKNTDDKVEDERNMPAGPSDVFSEGVGLNTTPIDSESASPHHHDGRNWRGGASVLREPPSRAASC